MTTQGTGTRRSLSLLIFLTATLAFRAAVAVADPAQETAWGLGVKESLDESRKKNKVVPHIQNGKIVASSPKSAKILQFVVDHCKAHAAVRTDSEYVVVSDAGSVKDALTAVGRFKVKGGAAKYTLILGSDFPKSGKAFVFVTWTAGNDQYVETLALEWDGSAQDWALQTASGEEKFSSGAQELK